MTSSIEAAERNYLAAWRLLATQAEGCRVEETETLMMTLVPDAPAFFNSAFVKPPADPAACLHAARKFFGANSAAFTLRFRESKDAAAPLEGGGRSPLMTADPAAITPPGDVAVKQVDNNTWSDHVEAVTAGFGLPSQLAARLFSPMTTRFSTPTTKAPSPRRRR